jgi:L-amino acid N-acyltransferase YncA
MNITLAPMTSEDREQVVDIFNYYVENTFAAYPDQKVPYDFFDVLLNMCQGYPSVTARDAEGNVVGFGMLRPYNTVPSFSGTAEITYFVKQEFTRKGIGKKLLEYLIAAGRGNNLTSILASVSSLNEGSLKFHVKNGFTECGRFRDVGRKKGRAFEVVYFQRKL